MTKLVYRHKDEWLLEIDDGGSAFARKLGGPTFYFGNVWNTEPPTVSAWRARIPVTRRPAIIASLEEARGVKGNVYLVPEERASSIVFGETNIMVTHSALDGNIPLDRAVTELQAIAGVLFAGPPTDRLVNPDRAQWNEIPPAQRRPGPEAPDVPPGALEHAQAAIDRFYADGLARALSGVTTRRRSSDLEKEKAKPVENAEHVFMCKATGAPAGKISLRLTVGGAELALTGFTPTSDVTVRAKDSELKPLHRDLVAGKPRSLYNHDLSLAPFYCSQCDACYAAPQWKMYETSPTRIEGMCPSGHRRRMHAL